MTSGSYTPTEPSCPASRFGRNPTSSRTRRSSRGRHEDRHEQVPRSGAAGNADVYVLNWDGSGLQNVTQTPRGTALQMGAAPQVEQMPTAFDNGQRLPRKLLAAVVRRLLNLGVS